ncbi:metal dependent phosphohydrolase [Arcobacter nitrofigilis DSM 7299]|uniref:Metal dependent phosphohydrolase n=1 Tax=Arcobacter nitrofigilis (strain ATCC 33309 / DSM 7299 / CCUG 15893 / LMG 7604 / NCTC 12251 / CI) TaxID=572480 RepID=D5V5E7_ARCNC|nr:HD domain-containing phosphohydrolase [Arcobacter nitrofigilis]ADG93082.1 metal dependent phosphohydrolase [Arcobacter nitrofigilis DSM 7299]
MKVMKNSIKVLGAYGSKSLDSNTTCIQINTNSVIDAGNIVKGLGTKAEYIDNIFLTHSHLDHLNDIPYLLDIFYEKRKKPITIYGTSKTLENLRNYILNWEIWPDFSEIELLNKKLKAIVFKPIEIDETIILEDDTKITVIKNNHTNSSCGYIITKNENSLLFSSDTYCCDSIWETINNDLTIKSIIIDVSFPSKFKQLAFDSKHLTPALLSEQLKKLKRDDIRVYINHIKPAYSKILRKEIQDYNLLLNEGKILDDGDVISLSNEYLSYNANRSNINKKEIKKLIDIGKSLTSEKNFDVLMEKILLGAKEFSDADGGTLYLVTEDEKRLKFQVVQTDSLSIKMGGTEGKITWPELPLYKEDGTPNEQMVAALCALEGKLINIPDVYETKDFNFEGTKKFDESTGYRTKSMLVIPMKNHDDDVIGVLQLLNKMDDDGNTITFTNEDKQLIESMASQAAVSITNNRLITELENLLDSFIKSIATAIGEKSEYTGGHINRVAEIAETLTKAINDDTTVFKDINFTQDEIKQMSRAAWLHDIGKIVTPEYVVDKGKKLETIYDRVNTVKAKFEIVKKDYELEYYKTFSKTSSIKEKEQLTIAFQNKITSLEEDLDFVITCNTGGEFMEDEKIERIKEIAKQKLKINGEDTNLLSENEVYNLCIKKGTLTNEERDIINNHVTVSYKMLETMPFPKKLRRVPVIAGSHHKMVKGGGYSAPEILDLPMTIEDKILAVADVFEALTANDRPYKKANSLNTSLRILSFMIKDQHLDRDIVKFFVDNNLHLDYANKYLSEEQMDEITIDFNKI